MSEFPCVPCEMKGWTKKSSGAFPAPIISGVSEDRGVCLWQGAELHKAGEAHARGLLSCDFASGAVEIRKGGGSRPLERMREILLKFPFSQSSRETFMAGR